MTKNKGNEKLTSKVLSVALAAALLGGGAVTILPDVSSGSSIEVQAANSESDFTTENSSDGGIIIVGYSGTSSTVNIPEKLYDQPVVEIRSLGEKNALVKSVSIPNTVNTITRDAFRDYTNLTTVTMTDSVETIGDGAFLGCTFLENVTLSKDVKNQGG